MEELQNATSCYLTQLHASNIIVSKIFCLLLKFWIIIHYSNFMEILQHRISLNAMFNLLPQAGKSWTCWEGIITEQ